MRHFIFEFITGGGLAGHALSESLSREGDLMTYALVRDLQKCQVDELILFQDSRFSKKYDDIAVIDVVDNKHETILQHIQPEDCLWLIAPETDQILYEWVSRCEQNNINHYLSDSHYIKQCSNKLHSNKALTQGNISVVPFLSSDEDIDENPIGYILKPIYGAGAEDVFFAQDKQALQILSTNINHEEFMVQPYIGGESMSVSMLCANGEAVLLACSKQYVEIIDNQLKLSGIGVNECLSDYDVLHKIANDVANEMPGLFGYIGIDLIKQNNNFYIVDINPRFTTSYIALTESLGVNVAEELVKLKRDMKLPEINIQQAISVKIDL